MHHTLSVHLQQYCRSFSIKNNCNFHCHFCFVTLLCVMPQEHPGLSFHPQMQKVPHQMSRRQATIKRAYKTNNVSFGVAVDCIAVCLEAQRRLMRGLVDLRDLRRNRGSRWSSRGGKKTRRRKNVNTANKSMNTKDTHRLPAPKYTPSSTSSHSSSSSFYRAYSIPPQRDVDKAGSRESYRSGSTAEF